MEIRTISIIGSGNIACHYYKIMQEKGFDVVLLSSRKEFSEQDLDKDLIIIAVSDKAIEEVAQRIGSTNSILTHCSGSMAMDILSPYAKNYGVIYPLQTLSKNIDIDFSKFFLCLEASNETSLQNLQKFCSTLSPKIRNLDSVQRKQLHIAAVFACNFTNHLLGMAFELLEKSDMDCELLFPLIEQTIAKTKENNPFDVQTGPAIRKDSIVLEKHLAMLDSSQREVYEFLSKKIIEKHSIG